MKTILFCGVAFLLACSPDLEATCSSDQECSDGLVCRSSYCVPVDDDVAEDWCAPDGQMPQQSAAGHCNAQTKPLACFGYAMGRCVKDCREDLCSRPVCGMNAADLKDFFSVNTSFPYCEEGLMPRFCNGQFNSCIKEDSCDRASHEPCRN